jgi:hypothetical protein
VPLHTLLAEAKIFILVGSNGVRFITMLLLATVAGVAHNALLVTVQLTTSLFASVLMVNIAPVEPVLTLLTSHWYTGAAPPFAGAAVKVMGVPIQTPFVEAVIATAGNWSGLIVNLMLLDVALQVGDVTTHVTESPSLKLVSE